MAITALIVAVLALLVALGARAKASGMTQELEDTRRDSRLRAEGLAEEVGDELRKLREQLAQVADGEMLSGDRIRSGQLYDDVNPDQALAMVEAGGTHIVDVRTHQEVAMGKIPGALHVPIDELEARIDELPRDDKNTLIYCAGGGRSAAACEFLSGKGYGGLHNLTGGMGAWTGAVERP